MKSYEKLMDLSLIGAIFCIFYGLGVSGSQVGDHSNVFKVPEEF